MSQASKLRGCQVLPPMPNGTGGQSPSSDKKRHPKKGENRTNPNHKKGDRWPTLNTFVDLVLRDLPRGDVAVWLVLYRDTRNGTAATGRADIARRAGLSVRGVAKALRRLQRAGLVKVVYQGGLNRGTSRYRVLATREPISSRALGNS